jgi:hypothetical protein
LGWRFSGQSMKRKGWRKRRNQSSNLQRAKSMG